MPAGSWDTHCHVFGPFARYPLATDRTYTPAAAPSERLFQMHESIGVARAVIVHPACHGFDLTVTLDAIKASGGRYRAVALVKETISDGELDACHAAGVRGVRFNFLSSLGRPPATDTIRRVCDRIARLRWHVVLHVDAGALPALPALTSNLPLPFVIDHFGRIQAEAGMQDAAYQTLLTLAAGQNCWVKISGADRASAEPPLYRDMIPFARALIAAAPERILWGTDWPHPNITGPCPRETDLVDLLHEIVPSPDMLCKILVDNPQRLYGEVQ